MEKVRRFLHQIISSCNDLDIEFIQIHFVELLSFLIPRLDSLDYVTYRTGIIKRHDTFLLQKYIYVYYLSEESNSVVCVRETDRETKDVDVN